MKNRPIDALQNSTRVLDLLSLIIAFTIAAWIAGGDTGKLPFSEMLAMRVRLGNIFTFLGLMATWAFVFSIFGLYETHVYRSKERELKDVLSAVSTSALLLWALRQVAHIQLIGPEFLIDFWLLAVFLCTLTRLFVRLTLRQMRRSGHNLRHLLIVGTNRRAMELARRVQSVPEFGYHLVGFVDESWAGSEPFRAAGFSVATDFSGFQEFITRNVVDEVMVCVPVKSFYERSSRILEQCEEQGITARFISDVFTPKVGKSHIERFDNRLVLTIETGGMRGWTMIVKRAIDILGSGAALLALSPVLAVIALLIKLRNPGPVFFVQERMGVNKRRFKLIKFRTMVVDAERRIAELTHLNEVSGPVFKIRDDPRITPMGRFLRKTSLDELPQLFNVFRGDMSLVGPRPLPVRDYEGFSTAWHRRRFSVKPGITCLWQVLGRNSIPFERWMELDMQYIDQWSLMLDLRILVKTIPAVMKGSGAS